MSVVMRDGRMVVTPIIGVSAWNGDGSARFDASDVDTIVHEFCHPFVNPLVDMHAEVFTHAGTRLLARRSRALEAQAYPKAKAVMYESMVRACVVRVMERAEGEARGRMQLRHELSRSFWYTPALCEALRGYEAQRDRYARLREFMTHITAAIAEPERLLDEAEARVPRLIGVTPVNGAEGLGREVAIRLEFDRPMDRSSRGLSFAEGVSFERVVPGQFDDTGRTYTVTLRFAAGARVGAILNAQGWGLASDEGYSLDRIDFAFGIAPER